MSFEHSGADDVDIVVLSPILPSANPDNAGEWYVRDLLGALDADRLVVIAPNNARNRRAADEPGAARHHLVELIDPPLRPRALHHAREALRRTFPVRPINGFIAGLERDALARRLIGSAQLIDLQWQNQASMIPILRRWNRTAEIVITLHDVMSQQIGRRRRSSHGGKRWLRETLGLLQARFAEHRLSHRADRVIVFSEKDRSLLPSIANAIVVLPPIAERSTFSPREGTETPNALFVGPLHRSENYEGVLWLTNDVWPRVLQAVPNARLTVAGMVPDVYRPTLPDLPSVEYAGFVDDLDALYAATDIAVAPLLHGAGVKFKVVEAIARGVPVALTSVAAEGIGDADFWPEHTDDADRFAAMIAEAMQHPAAVRKRAEPGVEWANRRYGAAQFSESIRQAYDGVERADGDVTGRLRIALVTPWSFDDPRAWSGMIAQMRRALESQVKVMLLSTAQVPTSLVDRALARLLGAVSHRRYLWDFGICTSIVRGLRLRRRLRGTDADVVLAVVASTDLAFAGRIGAPVVQVVDATFEAIRDFYPMFSDVHPISAQQAELVARRSTRATAGFVASSDWARRSLIDDYGVAPRRVVVAPTGPGIDPERITKVEVDDDKARGTELEVLVVASDWERKGGRTAVDAVAEARRGGLRARLIVVGEAPEGLPEWVERRGRLGESALSAEYARADVLLELATANAAGVTLTDAAAHGLPTIAARVGGVANIVLHDRTGILVEAGATIVGDAADALQRIADPALRSRMSEAAREHQRDRLSWSAWTEQVLEMCRSAVRSRGGESKGADGEAGLVSQGEGHELE